MDLGPLGPVDPWTGKDPCPARHANTVEVRTQLDSERVAWWCPDCETQFDADWLPPQSITGALLHKLGVGPISPVTAILNRATGEFVTLDPPLCVRPQDLDRVVAERQREIEEQWAAENEAASR
jgi:hypothetical protein